MKIAFFNTKPYDKEYFDRVNFDGTHQIRYFSSHLDLESTSLISVMSPAPTEPPVNNLGFRKVQSVLNAFEVGSKGP